MEINFFPPGDGGSLPRAERRQQFWCDVAVAVAGSSNSTKAEVMTKWADYALAEFDKRFAYLMGDE